MKAYLNAIVVFIVLLVLYSVATMNTSTYEDYLYGFWVAEGDDFCEDSDIESMLVFIGEADRGWLTTERTCYIIIMNDLCNQGFTLKYRPGWSGIGVGRYCVNAEVTFDSDNVWDDRVRIEVDVRDGTLKVLGDGVLYARLNKQHDTTNLARCLAGAEIVG